MYSTRHICKSPVVPARWRSLFHPLDRSFFRHINQVDLKKKSSTKSFILPSARWLSWFHPKYLPDCRHTKQMASFISPDAHFIFPSYPPDGVLNFIQCIYHSSSYPPGGVLNFIQCIYIILRHIRQVALFIPPMFDHPHQVVFNILFLS